MRSFLPSTFWDLEMYSIYSLVDLTTLLGDLPWESLLSIFLPIGISWVFWIYFLLHPRKTMEQSRFGRWLSFWKEWFLGSILLLFLGGTVHLKMRNLRFHQMWWIWTSYFFGRDLLVQNLGSSLPRCLIINCNRWRTTFDRHLLWVSYCWWFRNPAPLGMYKSLVNHRIFAISTGAGLLWIHFNQQYDKTGVPATEVGFHKTELVSDLSAGPTRPYQWNDCSKSWHHPHPHPQYENRKDEWFQCRDLFAWLPLWWKKMIRNFD